jgi:serine/threonine-protein kinase
MTQPDRCPECGAERHAGICPRCLIRLGIDGSGPDRSGRSSPGDPTGLAGGEPTAAGVMETLAASIGPVPRVLLRDTAPGEAPGPIVRPGCAADHSGIRYRIDGEIARGGMGTVLKGRDHDLGRDVALKVLREDRRDDVALVRRFIEEAQIGGQLQHPGVVPIYELGTLADRRPFFAMKLVKGHTLAQLLEARKGPEEDRPRFLAIYEAVCQTVAYAHARGVIHRDLKPSNVMVGSFGEAQVMDWGLAKVLPRGGIADDAKAGKAPQDTVIATGHGDGDAPELSRPGSAMGTPAYMAPEQARGEADLVDERADVFALGSVLCEVLTGEPAFLGRSSAAILRTAALGDTADALARLGACGTDAELVALARDCLAREAEDRPRHAGEVAERVAAYLAGVQDRLRAAEVARAAESARAEEANVRARAERRARRFQAGLAASLLLLTSAGGLSFTYWLQQRQHRAARFAQVLAETRALRDKARRDSDDPAAWHDALAALERAEGQGPAEQVEALRGEIQTGLDQAESDARLRQELVEIRANQEDVGAEGTDAAYATAFRAAEMDLDALEPGELARRLRRRREAVAIELSAFLDDWSAVRREARRPVSAWRKPLEAARLADPDPYRDRLREALLAEDRRREAGALKALAAAPEAADQPAPTAVLLGRALADNDQAEAAVALLRPAAVRHPGDVWVNHTLAGALAKLRPPAREEAVRYYTAARVLRPETAHELAHLLERMGRGGEAEAVFRDLAERRPENPRHLACLGRLLTDRGRSGDAAPVLDRAVAAARAAIRLQPHDAAVHYQLGNALNGQGKVDEATAACREAVRLKPDDAVAHHYLGNALRGQGKVDEAIAAFREAIRLKPDLALAHNCLGAILCEVKQDYTGAEAEFREAIRLEPDLAGAHTNLGAAMHGQGKVSEAIAACREAIRLKPDDALALTNLGAALRGQGKVDEAIAAHRQAIRLKPDLALAHNRLGGILCDVKHDYSGAEAEFREAIRVQPHDAAVHDNLGNALSGQGKVSEAIAAYREAIRLKPDYARAHAGLGAALHARGKVSEAIAAYGEAIRLKPGFAEAHYNLGNALRGQGKVSEAIAEYREVIRLKPGFAEAHCNLGNALRGQRRMPEAIAAYREAIRIKPDLAEAHYNLGIALRGQGKVSEAIAAYREALRLRPDFAGAHNNLGGILCDVKHEYTGAEAEFREAIRLKPDDALAHDNLGNALRAQRKLPEAVAAYREAIRLKPDFAGAHANLGSALRGQGKLSEAIAAYREAIRLRPDFFGAHYNLGIVLVGQGKVAEAIAAYREALRLKPDFAEAHCNLGEALRAQGKVAEAIATYHEAIRIKPDLAEAHCNLSFVLQVHGQFREALCELRRGHELGSKRPGWPYPSAEWVRRAERSVALGAHLPAVIRGDEKPKDAADGIVFADLAYQTKQLGPSVRLYAESFRADPKLAEDTKSENRYSAARAAALAGAGQGEDDLKPDDAARAKLRGQALDWLKAELAARAKVLDSGDAQARRVAAGALEQWRTEFDLAGVRDEGTLATLPGAEQAAWQSLWAEVDALLIRARGGRP